MGKLLIIKGADFQQNAIEVTDSANYLAQGYIGPTNNVVDMIVRPGGSADIAQQKFVIFVKNIVTGELFSTDESTVFVPEGYYYKPCVASSDMSESIRGVNSILSDGKYITKEDIYTALNANESVYPFYGLNISNGASLAESTNLTIEDALAAGVKIYL